MIYLSGTVTIKHVLLPIKYTVMVNTGISHMMTTYSHGKCGCILYNDPHSPSGKYEVYIVYTARANAGIFHMTHIHPWVNNEVYVIFIIIMNN